MQNKVEQGDIWVGHPREYFRVIDVVDVENNIWIHYMRLRDNAEYSCLKESFTHRFNKVLNEEHR